MVFLDWGYIRCCGNGLLWFRSYSDSLFQTPKSKQKALPRRTALRLGSVFPRYGVHPGASPPVCFAAPPLDVCGFAAWRCAPNPRMDTFARPAEGAKNQKPHQEPKPKPKPKQIKRSQPSAAPTWDWVCSVGVWSAVRPPSPASPHTVGLGVFSWKLVGCQAAIASRLAPTVQIACCPCGGAAPLNGRVSARRKLLI